jgi:hypothetical protein
LKYFFYHQLFEGEAEVPVDDGQVEPVAVQRANLFSGLNHLAQILETFFSSSLTKKEDKLKHFPPASFSTNV